jgi:hypothetical protein
MPDFTYRPTESGDATPAGWRDAFAALPLEAAPADGWDALSRRLDATQRRRRRWLRALPLAAAAVLLLALAPAWLQRPVAERPAGTATQPVADARPGDRTPPVGVDADAASLDKLYAESARLEALLQGARDSRVASGAAAALSAELDARLGAIDLALMQPGLDQARQLQLWGQRVQLLRAFAGFEGTRRWLAANGERYDGALVRVD